MFKRLIITLIYAISVPYIIFVGVWLSVLYFIISFFIWIVTGKSVNQRIAEHLMYGPLSWFMDYLLRLEYENN